jgi:hypothetical protein
MVVAKVGENKYAVLSLDSTNGKPSQYVVVYNGSRFQCNCPDFLKHIDEPYYACKHVQAVYEALRWFVDGVDMAVKVEIVKRPRRGNNGGQDEEEERPLLIEKKVKLFWDE